MCKADEKTTDESSIKFRIHIQSDIVDVVKHVNEREIAIPVTRNLRQPDGEAVFKQHRIQLTLGKEERVIANWTAHTVNGTTFWRRGIDVDKLAASCEDTDFYVSQTAMQHLADGADFLQVCDLFVLPAFQGKGLASWLLREGPEIISEFLNQTFSYIVFPVKPSVFRSEFASNRALENEFARERFLREREKQVQKMLKSAGYHSIPKEPDIWEKLF